MPDSRVSAPATYAELKKAVEAVVFKGRQQIEQAWTRTYHETGRLINEHILRNKDRAGYGAKVFDKLSADTGISKRTLHECAQFHRCFPIVRLPGHGATRRRRRHAGSGAAPASRLRAPAQAPPQRPRLPRGGHPAGKAAKRFAESILAPATTVTIVTSKPDKFDRYLADAFVPNGEDDFTFLNNELLRHGHAGRKDDWSASDWEQ